MPKQSLVNDLNTQINQAVDSGRLEGVPKISVPEENGKQPEPQPEVAADAAAAPPPGTDTPEEPTSSGKPESDNGLILGKFKDMDQLGKGYSELMTNRSQLHDENTRLKQQVADMMQRMGPTPEAAEPQTVLPGSADNAEVEWHKMPEIVSLAEETDSDPVVLGRLARTIAEQAKQSIAPALESQREIEQRLAQLQRVGETEAYVRQTHPEAFNHTDELRAYIANNAEVAATYQAVEAADPKRAFDYLWAQYVTHIGGPVQEQKKQEDKETRSNKAASTLPSSQHTPVHAVDPSSDKLKVTGEEYRNITIRAQRGDQEAVILKRKIDMPELYDQIAKRAAQEGWDV